MNEFFINSVWPVLSSQYFLGAITMQLMYSTQSWTTWLITSLLAYIKKFFIHQFVFSVTILEETALGQAFRNLRKEKHQAAPTSVVHAQMVCEKITFFNDSDGTQWTWLDDNLLVYSFYQDKILTIQCAYIHRERLKSILSNLIEFTASKTPADQVKIHRNGDWSSDNMVRQVHARLLAGIFLPQGVVERVVERITLFFQQKQFYRRNNIPYHFGLLLHGVPGTGKSSLINALAAYYHLPIMIASELKNLHKLQEAPARIVLIEDIDRMFYFDPKEDDDYKKKQAMVNMSYLLNFIDGVDAIPNQILIMTTNHIERLVPALIRPGRIDMQVEFGYADHDQVARAIDRFYFAKSFDPHSLVHEVVNGQSRLYAKKLIKMLGQEHFTMSALMQHFLAYDESIKSALVNLDKFPKQQNEKFKSADC